MRIASLIARYLLGFVFVVFGLNGFLHFLPMPPMAGTAGQFLGALATASPYITVVFLLQLVGGILLLINKFVPLALVLLAPVIVNILLFHLSMAPQGIGLALLVLVLWLLTATRVRTAFSGLLRA